ncbi:MAG: Pr6Pr family membrane protein [Chloroflexi bacterium]|nr:Pr6Pr family membrane protein [Chloroflexota bacterium]
MQTAQIQRIVRNLSIVVVLAAIIAQAKVLADVGAFDVTRFFAFFTILSNLIGVAAFALLVARPKAPRTRGVELLRAGAAVYLTVTFFVVIFLLSGVDVQLQLVWVDVVLHKIFPVIVVLDWLLDPPRVRLGTRDIATLIVFPLAWTGLTMVRGAVDPAKWYPYPFLNPANGGYGQVLVTAVAITIGFVAISAAIIGLGNRRRDAQPEPHPV